MGERRNEREKEWEREGVITDPLFTCYPESETISGLILIHVFTNIQESESYKVNYEYILTYNLMKLINYDGIFEIINKHKDNFGMKN